MRLAWTLATALAALPGAAFDHSTLDRLLRAHVAGGRVDYDAFSRSASFPVYLDGLASASLDGVDERERLAFWINAYNAYTIALVNAHGERRSIRNVNPELGEKGPWLEKVVRAAGRRLSLDELEHGILRREFREPRVHFALVCAALGCPPLRAEAYSGARLERQLEDQARAFLARSPERNRVNVATRTVSVSPLLVWYRDDFGGTDAALGRLLARYRPPGSERELLLSGRFRLVETEYDWALNGLGRSP
jgi:hypothetical protein